MDHQWPEALPGLLAETREAAFGMESVPEVGALLRSLAASKAGGRFLELGTGTGLATCWILDGMDVTAQLLSIDNDPAVISVASRHLGADPRVTFSVEQGDEAIVRLKGSAFDFIFADAWPGKFRLLDATLDLLAEAGLYVIDDLLPQANWPPDHAPRVPRLVERLMARKDLVISRLDWSSGVLIATRRSG